MNEFITAGALSFNDEAHLNNHLNYLFRTDKGQKWTNEYTKDNELYTFDENGEIQLFPLSTPEKRQGLKEIFSKFISNFSLEHLRMVRFVWAEEDVYDFTDEMYDSMIIPMVDMHKVFPVLLFITHVDQLDCGCHYHAIIYVE